MKALMNYLKNTTYEYKNRRNIYIKNIFYDYSLCFVMLIIKIIQTHIGMY